MSSYMVRIRANSEKYNSTTSNIISLLYSIFKLYNTLIEATLLNYSQGKKDDRSSNCIQSIWAAKIQLKKLFLCSFNSWSKLMKIRFLCWKFEVRIYLLPILLVKMQSMRGTRTWTFGELDNENDEWTYWNIRI